MQRLLLVDGSNLLFQMFFGMPSRIINAEGKAIQGTLGFVGALLKIIRGTAPTHVAVLFDGEHENARKTLNPDYKANRTDYSRTPETENPFSQMPDVYAALDFLGLRHAETADCETDDWIAGYAYARDAETEVIISSFDSDFFQLIGAHVSVLRYRGERTVLCTPAYIREKFGIAPEQYADFKALTGDAADHIRGAEGIGPKTASQLLREFGSLEGILAHADAIQKPSVRASVLRNADRLRLNDRLIRLDGSHSPPFALEELVWHDSGVTTGEVLRGIHLK